MTGKKRILLIDDEPDIIQVVSFRLRKSGYEVLTASDGMQGFEMAKKEKPDLILLDLWLPVISGFDICKKLKAKKNLNKIPVILLTASTNIVKEQAEKIGADGCIIKPYEIQDLLQKVKTILEYAQSQTMIVSKKT